MLIILLAIGALLLSWLSVYFIKAYALKNLLDIPNQRSSHRMPTPRGGGLGIVLGFTGTASVLVLGGWLGLSGFLVLTASLLVAGIGFWDDHRHIPARWRFLVHMAAALIALWLMQGFPVLIMGDWRIDLGLLGYALGAAYLVWLLNLFNFMDGIDGIAASEAVFISAALAGFLAYSDYELAYVAVALCFASLGFLVWNWPRAKIFMGDVGSGFLGFVLGLLILMAGHHDPVYVYIGLILFAVFITDATVTLVRRYMSGQKWYEAHCSHAYQHAAKRHGHLAVVLAVGAVNLCWLLPLAAMVFKYPAYALPGLITAYLPLIYIAVRLEAGSCP
ncbi:MraY family glycosyltransferase [Methylobacter marinus]|uniref:MraY family glycosyltransferase n=1 Tax=Methylobacter marinus TaxID=34058 RepID=UPI00035F56B2|nr:glycosyltransferase family 4 protein [Methylobacter marinus]